MVRERRRLTKRCSRRRVNIAAKGKEDHTAEQKSPCKASGRACEDVIMANLDASNLATIRAYLAAIEAGAVGEDLARFFTPDARQVELPNRLNPSGGVSDLPTLLQRAQEGQRLLRSQSYEIKSEVAQAHRVAIEATWSGILGVPLGSLAAGATMKAHFAVFFELSEGRICLQRNYDCFEPW